MDVARLYYEKDRTQNEIAGIYGISRPMVSKLLKEAKEEGIVKITIAAPGEAEGPGQGDPWLDRLQDCFGIQGGAVVENGPNDLATNNAVANAALKLLAGLKQDRLGIGWGHIIGDLTARIERNQGPVRIGGHICPLIGNGGVGLKNYHSNELVRVIAEHSEAEPEFIYTPACALSEQELKLTMALENYHKIYQAWERLDVALVNIGNFPSVPDFASEARYGSLLVKQKAVGRILNYFVTEEGRVIRSDTDYAIQIPLELLRRVRYVVGICSANTKPKALAGVLRTGYVNYVVAPKNVVSAAAELNNELHI